MLIESSGSAAKRLFCSKSLATCKNIIILLAETTACSNGSDLRIFFFEQQKETPIASHPPFGTKYSRYNYRSFLPYVSLNF